VDLINSVMSTVVGLVKDKPIQLIKNIPDDLPPVEADVTRIRQVVLNLVGNAAKFTDEGTITIEAFTSTAPNGSSEVMVTVTDTGTGIALQDQSKLFQPFSQVDDSPTRKTGGTGLGLSICRSLIELHNGRIGLLSSEVGKGSTFYFALPMRQQTEDFEESPPGNQMTILAIDDDPQIISLYERYLKPQGFRVVAVADPKQAVKKARQIKPYAITLDIMMPGKTGWDIIRELKNDPDTQNIPVVICSILEEAEKGFNLGASDYLVKPFLQEDLLNAIQRLSISTQSFKILVIDDNKEDMHIIETMLAEKDKFQLALATSFAESKIALRASNPDVIILNVLMNEQQGFSVLEYMHSENALSKIPVILISDEQLSDEQENLLSSFGEQMMQRCGLEEIALMTSLEQALALIGKTPSTKSNL
jgi:CheY-like chemotaxis protein